MSMSMQSWKVSATKLTAVVAVVAVGIMIAAVSGSGSVAASGSSSSGWSSHGWPTAGDSPTAAKTARAVRAAAAARGALVLRAHPLREAIVDAAGDGEGPGDYFVFEEALRRPGSRERVGTDSVRCMLNVRTFMCDGTLKLDGLGKITINGSLFAPRDLVLAVTGGTGRFRHASGQFRVFDLRGGNSLFVIDLRTR